MSELPQTTSSGRTVKRTGMNDSKKSALQKIREARAGNIKRTDQYEVIPIHNFTLTDEITKSNSTTSVNHCKL